MKYGAIRNAEFFRFLEDHTEELLNREKELLLHAVAVSAKIKASVVEEDEREESGLRRILNFGHTLGHVIESVYGYRHFYHGEAVAEGMKVASRVSEKIGLAQKGTSERVETLLRAFKFNRSFELKDIEKHLWLDKKVEGSKIHFVGLRRVGEAQIVSIPVNELIKLMREVW